MLIWFIVGAPVLVAEIFRSPMVDYRLVVVGVLLPLVDVVFGGPTVLHTLLGAVGLLTIVMAATVGRRLLRRRLLGVPIGLFFHLVLDRTWTRSELFWWPAFGFEQRADDLPETTTSLAVLVLLEVVGLAVGYWAWRRYDLSSADNRSLLLRRGHLARGVLD